VSVHSLTFPHTFLHSREYVGVTPQLLLGPHPCNAFALILELPSSWPATLQPLCLGREPKARVATINVIQNTLFNNKIPLFINFKFPFYFCRTTETILNPTTSKMVEHFTNLKYHKHQHYNNMMYFQIFL